MAKWLIKTEPTDYSAADLESDGQTAWTGVRNALARRHLASMKKGDAVLVYHTGKEKAVVALARVAAVTKDAVASAKAATPANAAASDDPAVMIAFDRWLAAAVPLSRIRSEKALADIALVRQTRLSVMPIADDAWKRILALASAAT